MANRITRLLFWTGGVVLSSVAQTAYEVLRAGDSGDLKLRRRLLELERGLADGSSSVESFCREAVEGAGAGATAEALAVALPERVRVLPGRDGLIETLYPIVELNLVSDYPQAWLAPILERTGLAAYLPLERVHFAAEVGQGNLFGGLVAAGAIEPGHTLWVDHDSHRTSAAIRHGIDAAVLLSEAQFRRDLGLWGLLPMV
jgi:hypothetical protein